MAIAGVRHGVRARGSFNAEIKFEGEWVRFNTLVNSLNIQLAGAAAYGQKKFAEKFASKVRINIRTGGRRFGYPPHSPEYSAYKAYHGGPGRLLFWSGKMAQSVEVKKLRVGRYAVGILKGVKREHYFGGEGGILTVSEYANILEHGVPSKGIPARPVFSDTFRKDMKGIRGMKTFIELMMLRKLRLLGVPIRKGF